MIRLRTSLLLGLLVHVFAAYSISAEENAWMVDYEAAQKKASREGKDMLIFFTGSDWCGWCRKLDKEKLSKDAFITQAQQDYILVKIDFPRRLELPPEQAQQNTVLKQKYRVLRFPSIFLCDSTGKPYAHTQYQKGDPANYNAHLKDLQKQKTIRDTQLKLAQNLQGPEKARALEKALSVIPRSNLSFYEDIIDSIRELDPEDTSGFYTRYQIQKTTTELRYLIQPMVKEREFSKVADEVENYIRQHKLENEPLQTALTFMLSAQYFSKDHEGALKTIDRIITVNELNRPGRYAKSIQKRIQRAQDK